MGRGKDMVGMERWWNQRHGKLVFYKIKKPEQDSPKLMPQSWSGAGDDIIWGQGIVGVWGREQWDMSGG